MVTKRTEQEIISGLVEFKKKLEKKYKARKVILFGSAARTRFRKFNDLDLIIVSSYLRRIGPRKNASKLYSEWKLSYPVDFLCYSPEEFNHLKKHVSIVSDALKEGMEI